MGAVKKILAKTEMPDREFHQSRLFVDLAENIHIHYRELRLMFGVEEFFEFSDILKNGTRDIRRYLRRNPHFKEQEHFDGIMVAGGAKRQTVPLQKSPAPHRSKYFPNRLQVELQEESVIDAIHIHYRDYRLSMDMETFKAFAGGMKQALDNLEEYNRDHRYQEGLHPFRKVVQAENWKKQRVTPLQKIKYFLKRLLGKRELN